MDTYLTLSLILLLLISPLSATNPTNQDLIIAIGEMEKANYFTFVFLLNTAPQDLIWNNVTFLIPNDRILSETFDPKTSVSGFLLLHSIPSPLLFEHLQHLPSGSLIPSSNPEFMLAVSNNGRHQFFLNNVRIISPNICSAGSSIRCHGIDGVVEASMGTHPPAPCFSPPRMPPFAPPNNDLGLTPAISPADAPAPETSGCSCQLSGGVSKFLVILLVLIIAL